MIDQIRAHLKKVRGRRVILDHDLASLYGTTTKRLNEQVSRHQHRFEEGSLFRLSKREWHRLNRSAKNWPNRRGGIQYRPRAFTVEGAVMAAFVTGTPKALAFSRTVVALAINAEPLPAMDPFAEWVDQLRRLPAPQSVPPTQPFQWPQCSTLENVS